jgi:hypothetical protein
MSTVDLYQQHITLLSDMVQRNTQLETIALSADERDEQTYAERILPFLETNQYTFSPS